MLQKLTILSSVVRKYSREEKEKQNRKGKKRKVRGIHQIIDSIYLQGHPLHIQSCQRVELEHLSEDNLLQGL